MSAFEMLLAEEINI